MAYEAKMLQRGGAGSVPVRSTAPETLVLAKN